MILARCIAIITLSALASLAACDKPSTPAADGTTPSTTKPAGTTMPVPSPDNTATNKVDRAGDTKTPMDQSESAAAIKVTADIRRAIMDDKAMSLNAQNCKIITDNAGQVTLRGVVSSQAEKDSIQAKATAVAGVTKVINQLEVSTK